MARPPRPGLAAAARILSWVSRGCDALGLCVLGIAAIALLAPQLGALTQSGAPVRTAILSLAAGAAVLLCGRIIELGAWLLTGADPRGTIGRRRRRRPALAAPAGATIHIHARHAEAETRRAA